VAQSEVESELAGDAIVVLNEKRKKVVDGVQAPDRQLAPRRHQAEHEFGVRVARILFAGIAQKLPSESGRAAGQEERIEAGAVAPQVSAEAHVVPAGSVTRGIGEFKGPRIVRSGI